MVLGSHNSWSFLRPRHWWLRPFAFTAKCQKVDIKWQYFDYGVRCFDLRINFDKHGKLCVCHGGMVYDYTEEQLLEDLRFINNRFSQCYVRMIHEVRTKKGYSDESVELFRKKCREYLEMFPNIIFWCGRNLFNWEVDYDFGKEPTCEEKYSSVCPPKYLDDWFPWMYAKLNNSKIRREGTDKDILLIDFVNFY